MTKNFVQLDESKLPTTKGKNIDGLDFILSAIKTIQVSQPF